MAFKIACLVLALAVASHAFPYGGGGVKGGRLQSGSGYGQQNEFELQGFEHGQNGKGGLFEHQNNRQQEEFGSHGHGQNAAYNQHDSGFGQSSGHGHQNGGYGQQSGGYGQQSGGYGQNGHGQSGFSGQPQGGFGEQSQGGFGGQPQGGFGSQPQGGFSGQPYGGGASSGARGYGQGQTHQGGYQTHGY